VVLSRRLGRRLWKELALAGGAGAVFALSPLPGPRLAAKIAAFLVVAAGVGVYRYRNGAFEAAPADAETRPAAPRIPRLLWLGLPLYLALVAPTLHWLYQGWTGSVWSNDHGIFIPPLVGYLTWSTLRVDSDPTSEESSRWGFAWLGAGLLLIVLDSGVRTEYLSVAGLLLTLPGLSLLLLGRRRTRALLVPLAVTLLAVPIPRSFASELYLRVATAASVEPILHWIGIPAYREATVIALPHNTFVVSNACSGFATLYASLAVAVILACYTPSRAKRLLLLLAAPPLALGANIVRVLALVVMTDFMGGWVITSALHPASGVATFCVVLVALFAIAGRGALQPSPA
jgi:exosortase